MSEASNRAAIAAIVAATVSTPKVHSEAVTIDSEDAAASLLGDGQDELGRTIINGWTIRPGRSRVTWLTACGGMRTKSYEYDIVGYRSLIDDQESCAEADAEAIAAALLAVGAQSTVRVAPDEGVVWEIEPVLLTGIACWKTQMMVRVVERSTT